MPKKEIAQAITFQISGREQPAFRAIIVDRDAMSSGLLADVLIRDLGCDAVGSRPSDLFHFLAANDIHVIIISSDINSSDINSKTGAGLELATNVSSAYPRIPIIILVDQPTREATLNAFRAGARGVFNRQASKSELIRSIEHVRQGSIWAGAEETTFLLEVLRNIPSMSPLSEANSPALTARELQVVRSAATGKTNKAIASELNLSEHTVKNYLFRAFEKLGVSSRVELLFYLTMRGHSLRSAEAKPSDAE
jgi:two-component system nitrate/nitrite response regulator NarL